MIREWLIRKLGGMPVPEVHEGQYMVTSIVRKKPTRKPKVTSTDTPLDNSETYATTSYIPF